MDVTFLREQIDHQLETMDETQLAGVLRYIEMMQSWALPDDYDEDSDPTVGFFEAPPDFASRTRDMLEQGFGRRRSSSES